MSGSVFIFGAGYSARAFARENPGGIAIAGTTRSTANFEMLRDAGIAPLAFDGQTLTDEFGARLREADALVVSVAPDESGDPVLNAAGDAIRRAMPKLGWIGYLSTVGVYGDHKGAWIDETTRATPGSRRSIQRLAAENAWLALGQEIGVPVAVLRLSGIYGPGRNALANLAAGTARRIVRPGQVFNRIHAGDVAGALEHLGAGGIGGVFNVSDDLPSPPQDVVEFAARLMGVEPPPEIAYEDAQMTPMARSFWGETKRVSNARIRGSGFAFEWPDYRAALARMWADGTWRAEA